MVYRIRHHRPGQSEERSDVIEANSPAEAMTKFRLTHGLDARSDEEIITSVHAEDSNLMLQW